MEAEQLLTMCCEDPTGVTVVVGEPRCGKSTLFRYLFGQASYPGIYINTHTFLPSDTGVSGVAVVAIVIEQPPSSRPGRTVELMRTSGMPGIEAGTTDWPFD
jgi:ABC-type cobalamin/Fe3+-siderophores transport system ATPase subunit